MAMFRSSGILLLVSFFVVSCAAMLGNDRIAGERYLRQARQQLERGEEDAAIKSFRLATIKYRKLATAYFELANILLKRNTVNDRAEAAHLLSEAVRYDPDNVEYLMALARLNLRRKLTVSARRGFEKALALDSTNAEACYSLGYIYEQDFLHFQHMVDGDSSGGIISFGEFADKARDRAVENYRRAIELNPAYLDAYFRLAFIYYEEKRWPQMVSLLRRAVEANPDEKNAHLYLGLAYHRARDYEQAYREYQQAFARMDEEERAFYLSSAPLQPSESDSVVPGGGSNGAAIQPDRFWLSKDPLYLTDYNERLMEHFARIAYANLRFSDPNRKLEGWRTDRGKVYIRYGPPEDQVRTRPWIRVSAIPGQDPVVPSRETWEYPGFRFVFEDRFLTQNFEFKWGFTPYDDYLDIYRRMIKSFPEYYRPDFGGGLFDLPVIAKQFLRADGRPVVYLFGAVPVQNVNRLFYREENRVTAALQKGVFLFDPDWTPVVKRKKKVFLETYLNRRYGFDYFSITDSLAVEPGSYHLAVEILDPAGKHVGRFRDTLRVEGVAQRQLALSDPILADEIRLKTDIARVNRNRIIVYPDFDHTFMVGQNLYLYYEIYHLKLDQEGNSHYRVSFIIRRLQDRNILQAFLSLLPGINTAIPEVVTSYVYRGDRRNENHYRILQLNAYEPGTYTLTIVVQDLMSGQSAKREVPFKIVRERK